MPGYDSRPARLLRLLGEGYRPWHSPPKYKNKDDSKDEEKDDQRVKPEDTATLVDKTVFSPLALSFLYLNPREIKENAHSAPF